MTISHQFYVYMYYRPWDGSPCYVGKGTRDRWLSHAKIGAHLVNKNFANIFKKAESLGLVVLKSKIRENLTEQEAFEIEIGIIKLIGRKENGGPLVNLTDGGDGKTGWVPSAETREKISLAKTGRPMSEETKVKMSLARKGRPKTAEHRAKIGASHAGKTMSEASRAKMRAASQKRWKDPAEHQKLIDHFNQLTPEARTARAAKISEKTKEAMNDPLVKEKISSALTGRIHDDARRELTSRTVRQAYVDDPTIGQRAAKSRALRGHAPMLGKHHSVEARMKMSMTRMTKNLEAQN